MKKKLKGILILSSLLSVMVLYSPHKTNRQIVEPAKEHRTSLFNKQVSVQTSSLPPLIDYFSHFDYYICNINDNAYFVANVFDKSTYCPFLKELKVILNPKEYDFDDYKELNSETYVVESINVNSFALTKTFYIPTVSEISYIQNHAIQLSKAQTSYSNIITSLNIESDYKSSLTSQNTQCLNTTHYSSNSVESQAILDEYLAEDNLSSETVPIQIGNHSGTYQTTLPHDDTIINLIPKACFQNDGTYSKGGSEWGYFVKTFKNNENSKISSVLIYDITNQRSYGQNVDTVDIRTVLHRNYKYDSKTNIIQRDVTNNYCIGNPSFDYGLKYDTIANSSNMCHPNFGDSDYNIDSDNGYALDSSSISYIGVGKNSDKLNVGSLNSLIGTIGGAVITIATQGVSLGAQVAVGVAANTIISGITESLSTKTSVTTDNGKRVFNEVRTRQSGSLTNIKDCAKAIAAEKGITDPSKIPLYNHISLTDNQSDADKKTVPFLFKDPTDVIHYSCTYISSDSSFDYVAQFLHSFHAEIINDNSVWLFKWNPDHIAKISSNWFYHIGERVQCNPITINCTNNSSILTFGRDTEQTISFTPNKSGNYRFILSDFPSYTYISGNGVQYDSSEIITSNGIHKPKKERISFTQYLSENQTVTYKVGRKYYLFGQAQLRVFVYKGEVTAGSSETTHTNKTVNYEGFPICIPFTALSDGIYTFDLSPVSNTSISDTFLSIYDNKYREILCDDDGFGDCVAGISLYLHANQEYNLICRPYSPFSKGNMTLNIFNQQTLPDFITEFPYNTIIINDFNQTNFSSFTTSQTNAISVSFSVTLNYSSSTSMPSISMTIRDSSMNKLSFVSNIIQNRLTFSFKKDKLYVIELSSGNSKLSGGISLHIN